MDKIRMLWRMVLEEINRSKFYTLAAVILFAYGIYSGYSSKELDAILMQTTEQVFGQIRDQIEQSDTPTLTAIMVIFLNNVRAVLVMMILGIFLGLFPVFSMLFNGVLIGFTLRLQEAADLSLMDLIFRGLLPHGILELPAIFIAAGYGLRLGITALRRLFPSQRAQVQTLGEIAMSGLALFGFLVILLLLASIIESTITPWLLNSAIEA